MKIGKLNGCVDDTNLNHEDVKRELVEAHEWLKKIEEEDKEKK